MQLTMKSRTRGFSLIEVLVALLVISIGLLGIAKMQALALANTNGGRLRALAAIEAASLASSMQAERNYWGNLGANLTLTISGGSGSATIASSDTTQIANATVTCPASASSTTTTVSACTATTGSVSCISTATPCTAKKMAAYDVQQWAGRLQEVMGASASASVACTSTAVAGSTNAVSCQVTVTWAEDNPNATASESGTMASPSYTLQAL